MVLIRVSQCHSGSKRYTDLFLDANCGILAPPRFWVSTATFWLSKLFNATLAPGCHYLEAPSVAWQGDPLQPEVGA